MKNIDCILSNKKLNAIVTEFIRERKLNISLVFCHTILFWCSKKY